MEKTKIYSVLLQEAIEMKFEGNITKTVEFLNNNNCAVSYSTIRTYKNNEVSPPFDKASQILNLLDYPITNEELIKSLELSKKFLEDKLNTKTKYLTTAIRINPTHLKNDLSVEELEELIDIRCRELFGENRSKRIGAYIFKLIEDDLKSSNKI